MKKFKDKAILVTGGTGSFGKTISKRLLDEDIKELRILSRDEKKQDDMRKEFFDKRLNFILGDVRDYASVDEATSNVDYVFHAAALKQVPSCEFYPLQAVKTNILGANNVIDAAVKNKVGKVVVLSTDKAVYPINAMGLSKALMEKVTLAKARLLGKNSLTQFCITRYGNVMASRGSVIPLFIEQIKKELPITITNPEMTRFLMSLEESVELVLHAFLYGEQGDLFVQKSPACTIIDLANSLKEILNSEIPFKIIGTRHGEKLYESLLSSEERSKSEELEKYFKVPLDARDLNYEEYFEEGKELEPAIDYNSHNTERLNKDEVKLLMQSVKQIKELINV
jgi:UDP-N-acetylglucosamine 4,6-dehydratase